ncbi:hypothetical protein THAOC_25973 [Thalassiosira oceanica]|uniref:FAD dependent oxidoreductase domain-containing protein n=1 Tax=Thalassiosira oceanica TaxID=159749 RepID=K0S697_THAOC|nr:hypothetical protein THAOC_25973 [Thalassiosira oceanica]|eukprot:EJK54402.1 hypothetical protein THAOC_25973 [Thalassiosira oceanica]
MVELLLVIWLTASLVCPVRSFALQTTEPSTGAATTTSAIVIVGGAHEAIAASLALAAKSVLVKDARAVDEQQSKSPIPEAQRVAFFPAVSDDDSSSPQLTSNTISSLQNGLLFLGPTLEGYERVLANALQLMERIGETSPMFHTSLEFADERAVAAFESIELARRRFSFMGLNLKTVQSKESDGRRIMSRDTADDWGFRLSVLLADQQNAAVTMDMRTHLALLQANSLPKTRGVLGERDFWAIRDAVQGGLLVESPSGGVMFEYEYDYSDPFGGCDPLLRPSRGYSVEIGSDENDTRHEMINDSFAVAYSCSVGSGLDPLSSLCIANAVRSTFSTLGREVSGEYIPPSYSWRAVDRIVDYTLKARSSLKSEDGGPRRMYREFGYQ